MGGKLGRRLAEPSDFWAHVDVKAPDECWPWRDAKLEFGYGAVRYQKRNWKAHRLAWALTHGSIPGKSWVLHRCDNPPCCNPAHLFLGTHEDNMADMASKGRHLSRTRTDYLPSGDDHHARKRPEVVARGERNGNAKLTASDVRAIRAAWDSGQSSISALARRYGMTPSPIANVAQRRSWRHVPEGDG
jgi:hypothetical protein